MESNISVLGYIYDHNLPKSAVILSICAFTVRKLKWLAIVLTCNARDALYISKAYRTLVR